MTAYEDRAIAAVLGAWLADAAALGLHWIYDLDRVAEVAGACPEFHEPKRANYEGVSSYFAHGLRHAGELSHYGETLAVAVESLSATGEFDPRDLQDRYRAHFDAGGAFQGYIDKPTRLTLARLRQQIAEEARDDVSGADDEQLPVLSTVPGLVACYQDSEARRRELARSVRVTHDNDFAMATAQYCGALLAALCEGQDLEAALSDLQPQVPDRLKDAIVKAQTPLSGDLKEVAKGFGLACPLVQGVPLSLWLVQSSGSFMEAVRRNILAGGDSCGRAMLLGALAGAQYGVGGLEGIPYSWIARLSRGHALIEALEARVRGLRS